MFFVKSLFLLDGKIQLTKIPRPSKVVSILIAPPIIGIKALSHKTNAVKIRIPSFPIVFSIFNFLQIKLLIVITNIDVLIVQAINNSVRLKTAIVEVIFISNKIAVISTKTIGVNIPKPIVEGSFLVSTKSVRFKNLGASHRHNSHIIITVTKNFPSERRYDCIDAELLELGV